MPSVQQCQRSLQNDITTCRFGEIDAHSDLANGLLPLDTFHIECDCEGIYLFSSCFYTSKTQMLGPCSLGAKWCRKKGVNLPSPIGFNEGTLWFRCWCLRAESWEKRSLPFQPAQPQGCLGCPPQLRPLLGSPY